MLKPQDCVLLLKLLAHPQQTDWSQRDLASQLCISLSEINAGLKRLYKARLIRNHEITDSPYPIIEAAAEYLIYGVKYSFPVRLGELTRGIATSIAAPVFAGKLVLGNEPLPVWPYAKGNAQGLALEPLYHSLPKAVQEFPDPEFYDLLALVDIIRHGRARERNIAIKILKEKMHYDK